MTPEARCQAAIEILTQVEDAITAGGEAADGLVRNYFAKRRYAGSRDRAAVADQVYDIIRHRARIRATLDAVAVAEPTPRLMMIACLAGLHHMDDTTLDARFGGGAYGPSPLDDDERRLVAGLRNVAAETLPRAARLEYPLWMESMLEARFGDGFEAELAAMDERASVTIRANTLKGERDDVRERLIAEGITTTHCHYAPDGLIVPDGKGLAGTAAFRSGLFEVQDEGAQLASLMVDARPGQQVMDLCAGAGGKTLAMAARMGRSGQIFAADVNRRRLDELKRRAKRAGAHNIQPMILPESGGNRDEKLGAINGRCDRVVLDVPCSGVGTWRRNPELRWRYGVDDLAPLMVRQRRLLDEGAGLVRPGGRLIYITCSLLGPENEDQIREFLERHKDFRIMDCQLLLPDTSDRLPPSRTDLDGALCLTPATHGTDGFFVAVLARDNKNQSAATP